MYSDRSAMVSRFLWIWVSVFALTLCASVATVDWLQVVQGMPSSSDELVGSLYAR